MCWFCLTIGGMGKVVVIGLISRPHLGLKLLSQIGYDRQKQAILPTISVEIFVDGESHPATKPTRLFNAASVIFHKLPVEFTESECIQLCLTKLSHLSVMKLVR